MRSLNFFRKWKQKNIVSLKLVKYRQRILQIPREFQLIINLYVGSNRNFNEILFSQTNTYSSRFNKFLFCFGKCILIVYKFFAINMIGVWIIEILLHSENFKFKVVNNEATLCVVEYRIQCIRNLGISLFVL